MIQIRHVFCAIIFLVAFFGRANANNAIGNAIGADIKVKISRAEASEAQPNQDIEMSFDGLQATLYHSKWELTEFPVDLTYFFDDVERWVFSLEKTDGCFYELDKSPKPTPKCPKPPRSRLDSWLFRKASKERCLQSKQGHWAS